LSRTPIPADDAGACACGRLRRAARALTQLYDEAMTPAGLRVTQFSLLRTLAAQSRSAACARPGGSSART
jgi:hypothetical protein